MISINLSTIDFNGNGGGGGTPSKLQDKTVGITENGTTEITPSANYDGLSSVTVNTNVPIPTFTTEDKTVDITENGTTTVSASTGYDGLDIVTINVNVPTTGGGSGECSSAIDFSIIGYDSNLSAEINSVWNNDVAYSKTLYDAWNPSSTSAYNLYKNKKQLVYAPNIDTSNVTNMSYMFRDCTSLTTVPAFNTSNVTIMSYMFRGCSGLTTVPQFDTSKVTIMENMFRDCSSLTSVPQFDTSNVTNMNIMFSGCTSLTTVPLLNTSNVTTMGSMFRGCSSLTTVPQFDTNNVTDMGYMFNGCKTLISIPLLECGKVINISSFFGSNNITTLTTLGGFKDLKINWNDSYCLVKCPNLTYESVMNVINNLYDFRSNGDSSTTRTLKLNANSLALLSDDDKAIATAKGWILS